MKQIQYRLGGQGIISMFKKRSWWFGWSLVEVVTYRKYDVEAEMADLVHKLRDTVRQHERLVQEEARIKALIESSNQLDRNTSDPQTVSHTPKDSSKYRKKRGRPEESKWLPFARLVRSIFGSGIPSTAEVRMASVAEETSVTRVGVVDQPVGMPQENNNRNRKGNRNNQEH